MAKQTQTTRRQIAGLGFDAHFLIKNCLIKKTRTFRTCRISNSIMELICKNNQRVKVIYYFHKKLQYRYLIWS